MLHLNKCDVCGHFMSYIDVKAVDSLVKYLNDMSMTMSMNANSLMSVSQQVLTSRCSRSMHRITILVSH